MLTDNLTQCWKLFTDKHARLTNSSMILDKILNLKQMPHIKIKY